MLTRGSKLPIISLNMLSAQYFLDNFKNKDRAQREQRVGEITVSYTRVRFKEYICYIISRPDTHT